MNDYQHNTSLLHDIELPYRMNETTNNHDHVPSLEDGEVETINGTPITELSRLGYSHLRTNALADAIDCFRQILDHNPLNNYALVGIGDAYRKQGRFNDAASYYQRCLDQNPQNNYALFGLADCFRSLKQFHRAIAVWEDYLLIDGENVTVLTRVADAYRKTRNLPKGRELYERVMRIEPDNAYALIGLGHLYYDFKEFAKALECWQRMYEISKDHVDIRVLTSMGNCHRKMRSFDKGIGFFEEALKREPGNFYALFGIADCYRGLNQVENSLEYWNRILVDNPENRLILTRAGDAYRAMDRFAKAREIYQRALDIDYDVWAIHGLAQLARLEGRYAEAAESLERLLRFDPRMSRLYRDLADCYRAAGNHQAVRDTLDRMNRANNRPRYQSNSGY